jgi:hypothetical protein
MTFFAVLLGGLATWGIIASILVVARDGYRRQPVRPPRDTRADTTDRTEPGPSDLPSSQWLPDRAHSARRRTRPTGHAAGVMMLRPW